MQNKLSPHIIEVTIWKIHILALKLSCNYKRKEKFSTHPKGFIDKNHLAHVRN